MSERQQQILQEIDQAFNGVELGDGVGLHQTLAIDSYVGAEAERAVREKDEKHDWRKILLDPELAHLGNVGGFSFYDAAGLRFHLPAYLSLAVTDYESEYADPATESLMYHLTHATDEYNRNRFAILNDAQRRCVRDVLIYLREVYELESEGLDEAIDGYWSRGQD